MNVTTMPNDAQHELHTLAGVDKGIKYTDLERIVAFRKLVESGKMRSYVRLLPLALNLNGNPYNLLDHFPFESVFNTYLPPELLLKTARQVSKSTSMAARSLTISTAIPHFSTLFITPLYEQIRRFSTNYVRPFIEQSPMKTLWVGTGTENSVLQRSFQNYSKMYFSFALTSADRVRGVSAHANNFDEVQDMDPGLIPIIKETMSASKWRLSMYTGTPKTLDNTIEGLWLSSSQAEWCIPCMNCKHLNVPRMGMDLEKMIGPTRHDISHENPAVICANSKCRLPIHPRIGRWVHRFKERRYNFPGYHIPQVIMPIHYSSYKRWSELLSKQQGYNNYTLPQFYNEVLGESYDVGAKLLTKTDLENASVLPWENEPLHAAPAIAAKNDYILRVLGVDWGGGGEVKRGADKKKTENITMSFTCVAVLGLRGDGRLDVIYGRRLLTPHDHMEEAKQIMRIYQMFDCQLFAHDYNGAGSLRETIAIQAGVPINRVVPIVYTRSAWQNIMNFHRSVDTHSRNFWLVDKARSLQLLCQCIKMAYVRMFKHDYINEENRGLQHDFLSLMENKVEAARGPDVYMIQRNPHFPDDFAHAVNFAACSIWNETKLWPNIAEIAGLRLTIQQMESINPVRPWSSDGSYLGQP
jgi:hypothetical protein